MNRSTSNGPHFYVNNKSILFAKKTRSMMNWLHINYMSDAFGYYMIYFLFRNFGVLKYRIYLRKSMYWSIGVASIQIQTNLNRNCNRLKKLKTTKNRILMDVFRLFFLKKFARTNQSLDWFFKIKPNHIHIF
jgi:hypothetical protein